MTLALEAAFEKLGHALVVFDDQDLHDFSVSDNAEERLKLVFAAALDDAGVSRLWHRAAAAFSVSSEGITIVSSSMLSVVVPMRDEAGNVAGLISDLHRALNGVEFELICIDDGSRDDTRSVLREMRACDDRLRVLEHARSQGQSAALRSGVLAARGSLIVTLDGDGQNDPADIPTLVREKERSGATMVAGFRQARHDPWSKRLSSKIANLVYRCVLHDDTPDTGCGLKLFDRASFIELPYFDHMHRFLPVLIKRGGGRVVSVPVHHRSRRSGCSKYGVVDRLLVGVVDLCGVRWLLSRYPRAASDVVCVSLPPTRIERSREC